MNRRDFLKLGSAAALAALAPAIKVGGDPLFLDKDAVWTATGHMGPLRYVALYHDAETLALWDFGEAITLSDKDEFTVDFSPDGVITIGGSNDNGKAEEAEQALRAIA